MMPKFFHLLLSHILALRLIECVLGQAGTPQTIYEGSAFSALDQCVQGCFTETSSGCPWDKLGSNLQCQTTPNPSCKTAFGVPDSCYCRLDKQPAALAILSTCIPIWCHVGDPSVDLSSAYSVYAAYCSAKVPSIVSASTTGVTQIG